MIHILRAIEDIQTFVAGKSRQQFVADVIVRMATERAFEIISEASRCIPQEVKAQQPQIDWQGMADFGNILRHAYHRVNADRLWDIAERNLPPLKAFAEKVIHDEQC